MSAQFDFVSTTDKPALLAFSTPEWLEAARSALAELGYKSWRQKKWLNVPKLKP